MSNSPGMRDQRLRLYTREDNGDDGIVRAVFTFLYERWARLETNLAVVRAAQDKLQLKLDAVVEFDYYVEVPISGVLKDDQGVMWWVRGINPVRQTRRVIVGVERVTEELAQTFELNEGNDVLDGTHLVDPPSS